jgi:hypothetical protein
MKNFDEILKILNIKLNNDDYDNYRDLWYIKISTSKSDKKVGGTPFLWIS